MPPSPKPSPKKRPSRSSTADTMNTRIAGRKLKAVGDYYTAQDVSTSGRAGIRTRKAVAAKRVGQLNRAAAKKIGSEGPKAPKPRNAQRNKYAR